MIHNSIGSTNTANIQVSTGGAASFDPTKAMTPVAKALGMSVDDVNKALDNGQTLNRLASAHGISHDELIDAITQGLHDTTAAEPARSEASSSSAADRLAKMAEGIANSTIGSTHRHRHRPLNNHPNTALLHKTSKMLHMTSTDLVAALKNGTTLTDVANRQGVSAEVVHQAIRNGMILNTNS